MKTIKVICRHGVEYSTPIKGSLGAVARTVKMLETCCCYVCYNHECPQARTGKQVCGNECELFTKTKYCERQEEEYPMWSISLRAKEYAKKEASISLNDIYNECLAEIYEKAYIAGAKDQQEIDDANLQERFHKVLNGQKWDLIDKACKWFEKYLAEIGYPDDWCRDSEVQESGEKRFRKALEY